MNHNHCLEQEDSEDRGMVIIPIPLRLLRKIDLNRDTLGRADFIELCIDTLLGQAGTQCDTTKLFAGLRTTQHHKVEADTVTHAELEEFEKRVKDLLQTCIDCLPDSILNKATFEAQERSRQLRELMEQQDGKDKGRSM